MGVEFKDNRVVVKNALKREAIAWLHEAAGEVVRQTQRNLSKHGGRFYSEQKEQWRYEIDERKMQAVIGNPLERVLWTEFGTGTFADNGKGRKGWWVYVKGKDGKKSTNHKIYTLEEARDIMFYLRNKGLDARITRGQRPKRPFKKAYDGSKGSIIKSAKERFGGRFK